MIMQLYNVIIIFLNLAIDYCKDKPCKNSGLCASNLFSYTCTCPSGTTGKTCETGKEIIKFM